MHLCLGAAVSQMFNCQLVYVEGFSRFHPLLKNMVKLGYVHWRNVNWFFTLELENVQIVQFAEFVEVMIILSGVLVGSAKVLSISSKSLQDILTIEAPSRSVEYRCELPLAGPIQDSNLTYL